MISPPWQRTLARDWCKIELKFIPGKPQALLQGPAFHGAAFERYGRCGMGLITEQERPRIADLYVTSALLTAAMIFLFVYLVLRRTELVIHTLSGKNSIQLPLSRRIAG